MIDVKTWKATASWPLAPCEGPTGIAYDKATNRIFSGCSNTSVVVDAATGQGRGVHHERHARGRPGMGSGEEADLHSRTAARGTSPSSTRTRPTSTPWSRPSPTVPGAKTITVDPKTHNAYLFQPERGPAPAPPADAPPPPAGRGRGRGPQGPIIAAWFVVITQ